MIKEATITLFSVEKAENINETIVRKNIAKQLQCAENQINAFILKKKSLDARHGKVKVHLKYIVYTEKDFPDNYTGQSILPEYKKANGEKSVIIVGSGPAGLFAALRLLESGIKPIIVERGNTAKERKRDIAQISRNHKINPNSNYCFGEGGAGTFSDGKLYTRSVKRGNPERIYRIFHSFGAPKQIITDSHPHIGSDLLPGIVHNITCKIKEMGGSVMFNTRFTGFITDKATISPKKRVLGIDAIDVISGKTFQLKADAVILATGHSAEDVYTLVEDLSPDSIEAKTFALGLRVEHPRSVIDDIQYHGRQKKEKLPAAEYRLVTQVAERGVYSFCMCPGGFVVPSSGGDGLVVNGMSSSGRASRWSNSAIVVEVRPEDTKLITKNDSVMAGLILRRQIEAIAKQEGNGQAAPAQRLTDFLKGKDSQDLPESSYTPGIVPSRLDLWLPEHISFRLKAAFKDFDKKMKGFICSKALLIAPETRTSTPLRILRNKETLECIGIEKLYPAGEGSGYSGGIVSSAIDGERVAESICHILSCE